MIYPSIDLMNGKAVQLVQGKAENKKLEIVDIQSLAVKFSAVGPINAIDLDAAFEKRDNRSVIKSLACEYLIRAGGGIRSIEIAEEYIQAGVQKIIIGSKALDLDFMRQLNAVIGREKIIVALDSFGDEIVIRGWTQRTSLKANEAIAQLEPHCSEFLFTQVEKEGMMQGPDFERLFNLRKLTRNPLIAAGGISSIAEITVLEKEGIDCVLGMALYTGKIDFEQLLEFAKEKKK